MENSNFTSSNIDETGNLPRATLSPCSDHIAFMFAVSFQFVQKTPISAFKLTFGNCRAQYPK